jgi:hypothetical protein
MPAQPSNIKKTHHRWDSGGSPDLQSPLYILHTSITHLHANFTFRGEIGEMYNATSWVEVFHDTTRGKMFHDTSWIVNFNGKYPSNPQDQSDPGYQVDNVPSTQRPCSRIIRIHLNITPYQLIGTLSTRGGCYDGRLSTWSRLHITGRTAATCPHILVAYLQ